MFISTLLYFTELKEMQILLEIRNHARCKKKIFKKLSNLIHYQTPNFCWTNRSNGACYKAHVMHVMVYKKKYGPKVKVWLMLILDPLYNVFKASKSFTLFSVFKYQRWIQTDTPPLNFSKTSQVSIFKFEKFLFFSMKTWTQYLSIKCTKYFSFIFLIYVFNFQQ